MTTINPLTTDVDKFVDEVQGQIDLWFDLPDEYSTDLDDYFANLYDTTERVADYSSSDDKIRKNLIKLAAYAAIIWHALGENQAHKEVDYAT